MAAKKKTPAKAEDGAKRKDPNVLRLTGNEADRGTLLAQTVLRPSVQAAATLQKWSGIASELELMALIEELSRQAKTVNGGDMTRVEAILMIQSRTLDAIFNNLARRSAANAGEYLGACETYMRLALKAQTQCRATLETLATIKNPQPVAFVRQANIAHGRQQVNNESFETNTRARARAEDSENQQSKQLEQQHGERLECGTTGEAVGSDPAMATVGTIDRTENG